MFLVRASAALRSRMPRHATACLTTLRYFSEVTTTSRSALEDETMQQNKSTEIPSGWKGVKRFYEDVSVRPVGTDGTEVLHSDAVGYRIVIRGRELRTNGMNELTVWHPQLHVLYLLCHLPSLLYFVSMLDSYIWSRSGDRW